MGKNKRILTISVLLLLVCSLIGCAPTYDERAETTRIENPTGLGELKITVLNVGQGLSILIQNNNENLLYDGGDRPTSSYVVSYLNKHNATDLKYVIASHYDSDHIAGLIGVLNKYSVHNFLGNQYVHDSNTYRSLVKKVSEKNLKIVTPKIGETLSLGNAKIEVLSPDSGNYMDVNNYSIVIKIIFGNNTFLIAGDAEKESITEMLENRTDLRADIYIVGHHGSKTSTTKEFLQKVNPKYAIISCGKANPYGHPHQETLDLLQNNKCAIYRTDQQGEIEITCNGTDYNFNVPPTNDFSAGTKIDKKVMPIPNKSIISQSFIGNEKSFKFHTKDCRFLPSEPNRVYFDNYASAIQDGYRPCKSCISTQ